MRIINLYSENVKRLKAVDITPDDDVIVLSGKNGEGKTSVLDSIWLALEYRAASKQNPTALRAGQDKGQVTIDLGDYIVTRKFTKSGTTLEVRTPDGSKISSPQKLLDGLIGDLSFDPWEFSRKNEKEQRQMLGDVLYAITGGKLDLADFELRHKAAFEKRSDANREKKRLTGLLTSLRVPTDSDPSEEINVDDLTRSIQEAVDVRSREEQLGKEVRSLGIKIQELEKELADAKQRYQTASKTLEDLPEVPDVDFLKGQLKDIQSVNERAREVIKYRQTRDTLTEVEEEIGKMNDAMELIDIEKAEALEESPLPVNNLRVTPDGVMVVNDEDELVPFCQASAAQRLRISLAIAMAANPTLRVIRIADGSLLDDEGMDIVKQMATDKDFQVWVEYASRNTQDRIGVYIEDGSVA